jgi:acetyl esterase
VWAKRDFFPIAANRLSRAWFLRQICTMAAADYQLLIDDEIRAFIQATAAHYPAGTATAGIAEQRRLYDALCAAMRAPRLPQLRVTDDRVGGVACRTYDGAGATVVYLHGGGFVVGGLDSHDDVASEIAAATGYRVIVPDYRLSPEHPHPAAFDDVMAVVGALEGRIVLAGDSAGGNLAAAVALIRRDVAGQVLVYPGLGGDLTRGSYVTHAGAPMLTTADVQFYGAIRGAGPDDPTAHPLRATDLRGMPPAFIAAAECDPLHDDGEAWAAAIRDAGGIALSVTDRGLVHGHLRARHRSARAAASFARIVAMIRLFGSGQPWDGTLPDGAG